jgi:hypothetical protein
VPVAWVVECSACTEVRAEFARIDARIA